MVEPFIARVPDLAYNAQDVLDVSSGLANALRKSSFAISVQLCQRHSQQRKSLLARLGVSHATDCELKRPKQLYVSK